MFVWLTEICGKRRQKGCECQNPRKSVVKQFFPEIAA